MPTRTHTTAAELVSVTVNGREMKFEKGKNLLAALLEADIEVPHYCWHPSLSVAGNCRLCLIEIEDNPRPAVSCNMNCAEGLKIRTEGELVEDCRKGMMEFLLINHPLDCPVCDRGGECMLQRYSMEYGSGHARTTEERRRFEKPEFDPLIDIERNRCIMCTRCVRFMDEVAGEHTLAVYARGDRNYIATFGNGPVANNFSGNIIDLCPVGCLTSKPFRFKARAWELQQVTSTCTLCSAGCATTAWVRDGRLYRVTPPLRRLDGAYTIDEDTTQFLCNEGRFGQYYANSGERLTQALMADEGGSMEIATLEGALERASEALRAAAQAGPEKIAILAGARATNEEHYLLSKLARDVLKTEQIDWRAPFICSEAAEMASLAFSASNGDLDLLEKGVYDATLVIHAELKDSIPVVGLKIKEAARRGLTRLGILGCRLDPWLNQWACAGAALEPEALAGAVESLAGPGQGGEGAQEGLEPFHELLGEAKRGLIVLGLDVAGGALSGALVPAVLGLLGRLGAGWDFLGVMQGRNARGAFAAGAEGPSGSSTPDLLRRAAAGEIETLLIHRCDELVHHPQRGLIEKALEATRNIIVIDTFPSWITFKASVVLPGALFFETEGSLVSIDGSLEALTPANEPPGDAQEDWRLIGELAGRLDAPFDYSSVSDVFGELLARWGVVRRFRLRDLRLPGPGAESPQRAHVFFGAKTRPSFKLRGGARPEVATRPRASRPRGKGLRLIWHYAIQGEDHLGSRALDFAELRPERTIELNPADASGLGFKPGDKVSVSGCDKAVRVSLNESLREGVASGAVNALGLELGMEAEALPEIELKRAKE